MKSNKATALQKDDRDRKLDNLLNRSALGTKMQVKDFYLFLETKDIFNFYLPISLWKYFEELLGRYILMEEYYMKESLSKAMAMDQRESDSLTRFTFYLFFYLFNSFFHSYFEI